MEWYERIKARRIELNMTQDELAKKIGYSTRSSINKIEQGLNDIPQSKISDFAKALKTTPVWLLFGYDAQNDAIIDLYNKLDELDKAEIRGEIKHMLKADKYTAADMVHSNNISFSPRKIAAYGADGTNQINPPNPRKIT